MLNHLTVPLHILILFAGAWFVAENPLGWSGLLAISLTVGAISGFVINTGHELGHKFGMVRHTRVATWPDHPRYYQKRGGSGTHCSENATWAGDGTALNPSAANCLDATGKSGGKWTDTATTCVLYHSATTHKRNWCKHCALDFIFSVLSRFT